MYVHNMTLYYTLVLYRYTMVEVENITVAFR